MECDTYMYEPYILTYAYVYRATKREMKLVTKLSIKMCARVVRTQSVFSVYLIKIFFLVGFVRRAIPTIG